MIENILYGLSFALSLSAIFANIVGVALGIIFGALPGLTSTMGVALLIPLTFGMEPVIAFSALLGMYIGSVYGGSLTAIMINTPGTPAAVATLLEGPGLTAKGQGRKAMEMATIASFVGGFLSCMALTLVAPQLAKVALSFAPPEYFAISLFGLSIVIGLSTNELLKGIIAALLGLLVATIGIDSVSGTVRNTFGIPELLSGVSLVPALVGLFAISQVLLKLEEWVETRVETYSPTVPISGEKDRLTLKDMRNNCWTIIRSSVIGTFVGLIPATGGGTASFIAYNETKRTSKEPEKFGSGHLPGVAATEAANNATTGGALIPLLTLGIPGDMVTAVMLGALMIQGLAPGPLLFRDNMPIITGIFIALMLANVFMLILGFNSLRFLSKIVSLPTGLLLSFVSVLCLLGSYAMANSGFDVLVMVCFGAIGYILTRCGFPLAPLLLAMILSPLLESNFRRSMVMSQQDFTVFFTRPISMVIIIITFLFLAKTIRDEIRRRRKMARSEN